MHCPGEFESLWAPGQGSWVSGIPASQSPSLSALPEKDPGTSSTTTVGRNGKIERHPCKTLSRYHKLQRRIEHRPLPQNHCPSRLRAGQVSPHPGVCRRLIALCFLTSPDLCRLASTPAPPISEMLLSTSPKRTN